jgi:hypothetical protein
MTFKSILLTIVLGTSASTWASDQTIDIHRISQQSKVRGQYDQIKTDRTKMALDRIKNFSTAMHGGGGIDGGGNDSLDMQSVPSVKGDVVIQVPGAVVGHYGALRIESAGPSDTAVISRCDLDKNGKLISFSCFDFWKNYGKDTSSESQRVDMSRVDLNKSYKLITGTYLIYFHNTAKFVNIREDETSVITLTKIHIPATQEKIVFKVFTDYTNKNMQQLLQNQVLYVRNFLQFSAQGELCMSLYNKGYATPLPYVQFQTDGSTRAARLCEGDGHFTYEQPSRKYVTNDKNESSVYVLPGVYGIEFLNPQSGEMASQYGIVAE